MKTIEGIRPVVGNLYYWRKKVLCEYVGRGKKGEYVFKTTNCGYIPVKEEELNDVIYID